MADFEDIIVSSRIRLARNFNDVVFPNRIKSKTDADKVISRCFDVFDKFENYKVCDLGQNILLSMQEKHLISEMLCKNREYGALSLSHDETISIMINEEEHIREQCILKGFKLDEALCRLNEVDDEILEKLPIAYSHELGFLTTCPSNLGTGMRASVMLFLPALSLTNSIENLVQTLSKVGLTVRGNYGEGTNASGFMFQVSNSQTLGLNEQQIISNVQTAVLKVCEKEREAQKNLLGTIFDELKDKTMRAYGTLKFAYKLSSEEAVSLLSYLRFGVSLNIINFLSIDKIDELLNSVLPNTLCTIKEDDSIKDLDIFRAKYIRENI